MDTLIRFGGAIKALDENGRVGGYLVTFSDAERKDLDGDYFDAKTYLGAGDGNGRDVLFHHGLPVKADLEHLSDHIFPPMKTTRDDIGIFAEVVLDMADKYEKKIYELIKKKKLGWSSGAANHTVKREKDGYLKRWIIAEGSMTPTPAEPLHRVVPIQALKSLDLGSLEDEVETEIAGAPDLTNESRPSRTLAAKLNQHIEDLIETGRTRKQVIGQMADEAGISVEQVEKVLSEEGQRPSDAKLKAFARALDVDFAPLKAVASKIQSIKGMFEDTLSERGYTSWQLWDVYSMTVKKLANAARSTRQTGVKFDLDDMLDEATGEYVARLKTLVRSQIDEFSESEHEDRFYLKALHDPKVDFEAMKNVDLSDHSQLAVNALRDILGRFRGAYENRVAANRPMAESHKARIEALIKDVGAIKSEMETLLQAAQPMATEQERREVESAYLRLKARRVPKVEAQHDPART